MSGNWFSQIGHTVLDVAGLVPVIGEPADLLNAAWYAAEGDRFNAALSAASAVPLAGTVATGARLARRGSQALEAATTAGRGVDEAATATRGAEADTLTLAGVTHRISAGGRRTNDDQPEDPGSIQSPGQR